MTKPTEGPYRAEGANIYGGDGWTIGITTGLARQAAANARLLAASWEMREQLREIVDAVATCTDDRGGVLTEACQIDDFSKARALLARIEGGAE